MLERRIKSACSGINSLYLSNASLTVEYTMQQCHNFMDIILLNLKKLLIPQFSSLMSIAYCLCIDKMSLYGYSAQISMIVEQISQLPIICRLFEVAALCKENGYIGEYMMVTNQLKSIPLNPYHYSIAKNYYDIPDLKEFIYDRPALDIALNELFYGYSDIDLAFYLLNYFRKNQNGVYLLKSIDLLENMSQNELESNSSKLEQLVMQNTLMSNELKINFFKFILVVLEHNCNCSDTFIQYTYGYIKMLEYSIDQQVLLNIISTHSSHSTQNRFNFLFQSIINNQKSINYEHHPNFKVLLVDSSVFL